MGIKRSRLRLPLPEYKRLCEKVHIRDNWRCKICRYRHDLHAHHIVFRSQGGPDSSDNLITICQDCHEAIHDRYVILLPLKAGEPVDADIGMKILRVNGWKPKRKVR
jgi:5-methylcytosine-specific restriction endonuclease McrA